MEVDNLEQKEAESEPADSGSETSRRTTQWADSTGSVLSFQAKQKWVLGVSEREREGFGSSNWTRPQSPEARSRKATEKEYGLCRRTVCFILFVLHSDFCVFLFAPLAFGWATQNILRVFFFFSWFCFKY
jgi:hypothetical protein